jgi:hypothetical protein
MRRHYRNLALVISLGLAAALTTVDVSAQTNPLARGNDQAAAPRSEPIGRPAFGQHGMGRPQPRNSVVNVTPVPEPGQWAMMLAGLALVGWIVRRNSKR